MVPGGTSRRLCGCGCVPVLGRSAEHARGFCSAVDGVVMRGWTQLEEPFREKIK